jgi:aldose 1-epimerase
MLIRASLFGKLNDGRPVKEFMITNDEGFSISILEYGAVIRFVKYAGQTPDCNVVLGFDTLKEYENDSSYVGCIIGRVANRIENGEVKINGKSYSLNKNFGNHTLHGGSIGWNKQLWVGNYYRTPDGAVVELKYFSNDGEEGFPGNIQATVRYSLNNKNEVKISFEAQANTPTLINLTQHTYFNLSGKLHHQMNDQLIKVDAQKILQTNSEKISSGKLLNCHDCHLDLSELKPLSSYLLKHKNGIDNFFVSNSRNMIKPVAKLIDPSSHRQLEVFSDAEGMQIYTGEVLVESQEKYEPSKFYGICLESHNFPYCSASENLSLMCIPGIGYRQNTVWRFSKVI